jgi:SGNH hydrolase-like domain, acetyltransferase AlgX
VPVQNLGWSGFGPLEYGEVMRQFGAVLQGQTRQWILIAYFEGNDLSNTQTAYQRAQASDGVLTLNLQHGVVTNADPSQRDFGIVRRDDDNYLYPLDHVINNTNYPLAYISDYIWWLNGSADTYRQSRNVALFSDALRVIRTLAGEACVGLVYVPDKSHIYLPYADPQGNRRWVLENALTLQLDAEGWLSFGGLQPVAYDVLMENIDNQRNVIHEVADELGIHFIDLVPALQAAVTTGEPSYYAYDSHWSVRGHQIAGDAIAQYLRTIATCSG